MKPTELLNSLDYVGADLLAEAEQNVLVRTRRPWLKTAIAAVLVAAVGVGGVLTLKHFSMRSTVSDPVPVATNTTETVNQTEKLPTLELENSWQMLPGRLTVVSGDLSLCADNITSLPVYANRMSEGSDGMYYYYNEEQMRSMLDEAVRRLGANPVGEVEVGHDSDGSVYYLELNTDDGIVAVKPDGSISVDLLDGKYDIDPERAESSEDLSLADGAPLKNDILACVQRDQALLGLSENQMVLFDGELHDVYLFPAREDPTEQLLVRSFGAVSQGMTSSLSSMDFLDWYQRPDSTDWNNTEHDWLSLIGWYPTLTLAEAKEMALAGQGMCVENMDVNLTEDRITGVELVYPRMDCHITMIPYYRFWFSRSFQTIYGDNSDFYVCVPAIRPEFLTDWQPDSDPHTPNEAPVFTIRADYHYYVSGYAGDVDALQFPGHEPRDEVTADVDGDGNKELVYLYTDGSRFVGIAAYGLDDGRPVLKAADMLSLNGRTARLELDEVGGNVWFFLISNSANQNGTGANTCQSVLTVQDGAIVLSGSLPEDCRIEADTPFTMIRNDRDSYFTNGRIMVWDLYTNGIIVRQNMITGESETLFELEIIDDTTNSLLAVTDQRLYFGTNHPESTQFTGVYSVNYQNTDRTEIAQYRELTCEDGWIILRDSADDVASAQIVIDRSDRKVLDLAKCRNGAVVDGSYYYIYAPAEQDADALNALSEEARNELYRHMQYEVCKLDPDGTVTKIGTIESDYANAYFQIDAQKKEIICSEYDAETGTNNFRHLDLFTLAPKDDTANTN